MMCTRNRVLPFFAFLLLATTVSGLAVWPQPTSMQRGGTTVSISPQSFNVQTSSRSTLLKTAIQRYQNKIFFPFPSTEETVASAGQLNSLVVGAISDSEVLQFGMDESYNLTVSGSQGVYKGAIVAATIFGAMRGLETFAQLIDWQGSSYVVQAVPVTIVDSPRFPWRGLLIDSARHYLDVGAIKKTIDAMSYSKFNTLHWHVTDAQSFPVVSTSYPLLSKGAWAPQAVFTQADILGVVRYGLERGIRVMAEFDVPGHSASWGVGYPSIVANCPNYASNINNIALNPSNNFTFEVLSGFLGEMASLFPDNFMHVGGDEVVFGCWEEDPGIQAWMRRMGFTRGVQVEQYFEDRLKSIFKNMSRPRTMVVWQELFNNNIVLDPATIIDVWKDKATLQQVVSAGFRGMLSAGWYLDQQIPDPSQTWYEWEDTWKNFYVNDPVSGLDLTEQQASLVVGGEAAMWGEQVDSTNFESRVWPRACAVAERLWSPANVNSVNAAFTRLVEFRCRIARRGVHAGPIAPDWCQLPRSAL